MNNYPYKIKNQKGATLIVSLVILTIVTVLGLASMRNSNLELKMAASTRDNSIAFQNAESALRLLEKQIATQPYTREQMEDGCVDNCFNPACTDGLCFNGELDAYTKDFSCKVAKDNLPAKQMWENSAIWATATTHGTKDIPNSKEPGVRSADNKVKYIVEFLCFVKNPNIKVPSPDDSMLPLYRITVRAEGEAQRSTAMLQSVFRGAVLNRNAAAGGGEEEPEATPTPDEGA